MIEMRQAELECVHFYARTFLFTSNRGGPPRPTTPTVTVTASPSDRLPLRCLSVNFSAASFQSPAADCRLSPGPSGSIKRKYFTVIDVFRAELPVNLNADIRRGIVVRCEHSPSTHSTASMAPAYSRIVVNYYLWRVHGDRRSSNSHSHPRRQSIAIVPARTFPSAAISARYSI